MIRKTGAALLWCSCNIFKLGKNIRDSTVLRTLHGKIGRVFLSFESGSGRNNTIACTAEIRLFL
jgi:hypothetical protein